MRRASSLTLERQPVPSSRKFAVECLVDRAVGVKKNVSKARLRRGLLLRVDFKAGLQGY